MAENRIRAAVPAVEPVNVSLVNSKSDLTRVAPVRTRHTTP